MNNYSLLMNVYKSSDTFGISNI